MPRGIQSAAGPGRRPIDCFHPCAHTYAGGSPPRRELFIRCYYSIRCSKIKVILHRAPKKRGLHHTPPSIPLFFNRFTTIGPVFDPSAPVFSFLRTMPPYPGFYAPLRAHFLCFLSHVYQMSTTNHPQTPLSSPFSPPRAHKPSTKRLPAPLFHIKRPNFSRWTSPFSSSFFDGKGRHTTLSGRIRPRNAQF